VLYSCGCCVLVDASVFAFTPNTKHKDETSMGCGKVLFETVNNDRSANYIPDLGFSTLDVLFVSVFSLREAPVWELYIVTVVSAIGFHTKS
jgi:hypothetical protein